MDNLINIPEEIKPEVIEDLIGLMGEEEVELYADYEEWMDNQINGQTYMPFIKKRVNRRKYLKGKVIFTKAKIAGSILKVLRDSKGARAHITCKKIMSFTHLSESTVRRYLYDVLDWLVSQDLLRFDIDKARGYYAWTEEWETMKNAHGDLIEPKKFLRSPWLRKHQTKFASALKKGFTPPCQNLPPRTLKEDYPSDKPISKEMSLYKRGRKLPRKLAKVARNLLRNTPLSKYARIDLSKRQEHWLAWRLLAEGYWRNDVSNILFKALRITDSAVSDGLTENPKAYLQGVIDKIKAGVKKPTPDQLKAERVRFWQDQKQTCIALLKAEGIKPNESMLAQFDSKVA